MCENCKEFETKFSFCPYCGEKLVKSETEEKKEFTNIFEYLTSLDTESTYDIWRYAWSIVKKFERSGKDPYNMEHFNEIVKEVEKEFKK